MAGYCTVKQRFEGSTPDGSPTTGEVTGRVEFTPYIPYGDAWTVYENGSFYMVPATSVKADIVDGVLEYEGAPGVSLFAGGEGSSPETVQWIVSYHDVLVEGQPAFLKEFIFDVSPDTVVDLSNVTPVPGVEPVGIIKGPKGDPGDRGPLGSMWHQGTSTPSSISGQKVGDWYIRTTTGDAYELISTGWVLRMNLLGPPGAPGQDPWVGTLAEYNALSSPDQSRLHIIVNG